MVKFFPMKFEPRDCWMGLFWDWGYKGNGMHIYICILPCFPFHFWLSPHWWNIDA
jgi:hypothetical protein